MSLRWSLAEQSAGVSIDMALPGELALGFPTASISTPAPPFVTQQRVRAELLNQVSRVVVKLGTGVLTDASKQPDLAQIARQPASIDISTT
jgi:hypothetical protein